jgi:hypothetical protein
MSLEVFALHLNGSHSVPVVLWLGVLFSVSPAHLFTYVCDMFVVQPKRKKELQEFVLNCVHEYIKFTMETKENGA